MSQDSELRLAVTVCATKRYQYAMTAQARVVHANLRSFPGTIAIVLVGDKNLKPIADLYDVLFSKAKEEERFSVISIGHFQEKPEAAPYKNEVQLLIAQMRTAAFCAARAFDADLCWSLDSDVIPKSASCFRMLRWILEIPDRYYEVAISPYPSQGGGDSMLCGRGTPEHP